METIIKQRLLEKFLKKQISNSHRVFIKQINLHSNERAERMTCLDPGFDKVYHRLLSKIK